MRGELPTTPLFAGLTVGQHFERSKLFDAALVALEAFSQAGLNDEDRRAQRAAMLHAYTVRIGAIIAEGDEADDEALMEIVHDEVAEATTVVRMLRS